MFKYHSQGCVWEAVWELLSYFPSSSSLSLSLSGLYSEEYQSTASDIPSITVIPRELSSSYIVRQTPLDTVTKTFWHALSYWEDLRWNSTLLFNTYFLKLLVYVEELSLLWALFLLYSVLRNQVIYIQLASLLFWLSGDTLSLWNTEGHYNMWSLKLTNRIWIYRGFGLTNARAFRLYLATFQMSNLLATFGALRATFIGNES